MPESLDTDEQADLWAAPRDASCYDRPNVRSSKRVHVANQYGHASCSGAPLDEATSLALDEVPEHIQCQRAACRKHWPSA